MKRIVLVALAAGLILAGRAFAQGDFPVAAPTATDADYAAVADAAVNRYMVPAYQGLNEATVEIAGSMDAFCKAPSTASRTKVTDAFAAVLVAWAGVDFFHFGPMAEAGSYERFAFWPDVHGTGARQLRQFLAGKDEKLLLPGELAKQSAAVQGLPALESLLFSGSDALAAADNPDPFRCALAAAVAHNLDDIASTAMQGWNGETGWAQVLRHPGPGNPVYLSQREVLSEILRAALTGLEQDRDQRLIPAFGDAPDKPKPGRAPYHASGQALPYLLASTEALKAFVDKSRLLTLVPQDRKWIANSIGFEFGNLRGALAGAGPDLDAALADIDLRSKLGYAAIVMKSLRDLFQNQVAPATGITPGFNSLDGD